MQANNIAAQEPNNELDSLTALVHAYKKEDSVRINILNNLASTTCYSAPDLAMTYANEAMEIGKKINYEDGTAAAYKELGIIYYIKSNYENSLKFFFLCLNIYEKNNDIVNIGNINNNIGNIYWILDNYDEAILKMNIAKECFIALKDQKRLSTVYANLGALYGEKKESDKAIEFFNMSLDIKMKVEDIKGVASIYNNIGEEYVQATKINEGITFFKKALDIYYKLKDNYNLSIVHLNISEAYLMQEKYDFSLQYMDSAAKFLETTDNKTIQKNLFFNYHNYYQKLGNFETALFYYKKYSDIKDSIFNKEKSEQLIDIQTRYETEKTIRENEILLANQELYRATIQRQNVLFWTLLFIVILVLIVAIQLFVLNKQKKKVNEILSTKNAEILQQKEEILTQNEILHQHKEEIEAQRDKIEKQRDYAVEQHEIISTQNQYIKDSIVYASRIQYTLMDAVSDILKDFSPAFIIFKPRDIVSGDFYWHRTDEHIKFLAVADCTGHGVPGALMSMLGISFLNDIFAFYRMPEPAFVLEELRRRVKTSLQNSDTKTNQRDGMDIAICKIDEKQNIITYSGANNSIYVVNDDTLIEYKAVRCPVGSYAMEKDFVNNNIEYTKDTKLYLFSDGFIDQLNGLTTEKYKTARFKNLISTTATLSLDEQKQAIETEFETWKTKNYRQIDDILIIGLICNYTDNL